MALTETQEVLASMLHLCGADQEMIIGTTLLLHKSQEAMDELILWIDDRNPELNAMSKEELSEIIKQAVILHKSLPKDLQVTVRDVKVE